MPLLNISNDTTMWRGTEKGTLESGARVSKTSASQFNDPTMISQCPNVSLWENFISSSLIEREKRKKN